MPRESIKARLLAGVREPERVFIEALGEEVWIRPLRSYEMAEAQAAATRGQRYGSTGLSIDLSSSVEGQNLAACIKAAYGLSCKGEKWTKDEAGQLPSGAPEEIAGHVDRLTGSVEVDGELVAQFRDLVGGSALGATAPERNPAGEASGRPDSAPGAVSVDSAAASDEGDGG